MFLIVELLIIIVFITLRIPCGSSKNTFQIVQNNQNCSESIIESIYGKHNVLLHVYDNRTEVYVTNFKETLHILWNIDGIYVNYQANHQQSYHNYLLYLADDSDEDLINLIGSLRSSDYWNVNYRGVLTIFLNCHKEALGNQEKDYENSKLYDYLKNLGIAKVLIVNTINCKAYSYHPYDLNEAKTVRNLTKFKSFQHLDDLRNGTIKVHYYTIVPSTYVDATTKPMKGIFIYTLHLWAKLHNAHLKLEMLSNICLKEPGSDKCNRYITESLEEQLMDILVPELFRIYAKKTFEYSEIVFTDPHLWLVPKPRKLPTLRSIFMIFTRDLWICMAITFSLFTIGWYYLNKAIYHNKNGEITKNFLDALKIILGTSIFVPKRTVFRIWILTYVIFSYHFNYMFQGKLNSFLTVPRYEERIDSMGKLAESNLKIHVPNSYNSLIINANNELVDKLQRKMMFHQVMKPTDRGKFVIDGNHKQGILILKTDTNVTAAHMQYIDAITDTLFCKMEGSYALRRGNFILTSLNKVIRKVFEGDLTSKWLTDSEKIIFIPETKQHVKFTFEHVAFAFYALVCGLAIGFVIFLMEIFRNYFFSICGK